MRRQHGWLHASRARMSGSHLRLTWFVLMAALSWTPGIYPAVAAAPEWVSPNRYRILLTVDPRGVASRSHSPTAPVRINFKLTLASLGQAGAFDPHTIEVVGYDDQGLPHIYDASRAGYEQYLMPWRIDPYFRLDEVDFVFVMPTQNHLQYAVYFDTLASGLGRPTRYPGLVGDGDFFREAHSRREIGPSKFGDLADFDGDGDLDLFEGGVEPFIYCHESLLAQTGEHRFIDCGRLTSDGQALMPSRNAGSNRAWMTLTLRDWDGDGDADLFPSSTDGPDAGHILFFRNTTSPGGPPQFTRVDRMYTNTGQAIGGAPSAGWFPTPTFVDDWDGTGDGLTDVIVATKGFVYLHRNLGPGGITGFLLADGVKLQAGGVDIELLTPHVDVADLDGDGDLDLVATTHGAAAWFASSVVFWYRNIGDRQNPTFAAPIALGQMRHYYGGVRVGDFFGQDGLLDLVAGTFWKVNAKHGLPKSFGGLLRNLGPENNPTFELALADAGSFFTEQFQPCDAGQQNGVRARDLDGDGDFDLVASTTDGLVLFYRNINNNLYPIFSPPQNLMVGEASPYPVEVYGPESGYARLDIADWNNDTHPDLLVADEEARVFIFLNDGQGNDPPTFLPGTQLQANGKPLDGLGRGSVLVCDWNNDGKKDLIFGMAPKDNVSSPYHDWPFQPGDNDKTDDEGFLYYRNDGTDASPVLAFPSWIRASNLVITYTRPNLGSFVDWDGDGKKDFIACHFEDNIRFYRNTASGLPNTTPTLSPAAGTKIVEPFCKTQMISGVDVVDWRGDGDLDVITGQGHGGSGLRFYERDYINDFVNNTLPAVTIGASEKKDAAADFDNDGDVDESDFGHLQACFASAPLPVGCINADLTQDTVVDAADVEVFLGCMAGANRPPGC